MTQPDPRDAYIAALERENSALQIALQNGLRSLEAEGRVLKKAKRETKEAKKLLQTEDAQ